MSSALYLGVDVGSSATKGVLVDHDGQVVARSRHDHGVDHPHPGWFEHDADLVWWGGFRAVVAGLLDDVRPHDIAAVAVSGMGPCVLAADAELQPLRAAILYGVDGRATDEIGLLNRALGSEEVLARSGSSLSAQSIAPKLMWLQRHEPQVWERTRAVFSVAGYLVHRLTGNYVMDHHTANQGGPPYTWDSGGWDPDWSGIVAPDVQLPELASPLDVIGRVTTEAAELTGLPEGLPVTAGTYDSWAEAISVGVERPGDVMVMYASTATITALSDRPLSSPRLWASVGHEPGSYTISGGLATAGFITDWMRRLAHAEYPELIEEAQKVPPGSRGLLMLPYFSGERTPLLDPDARGIIAGLTIEHERGELYRAALESVAFALRHNLETMTAAGATVSRIIAVGGGTQAGALLWPQIVSSVIGERQYLRRERIGACYGDAVLAARAIGVDVDVDKWNPVVDEVAPIRDWRQVYEGRWPLYHQLRLATTDISHVLAHFDQ